MAAKEAQREAKAAQAGAPATAAPPAEDAGDHSPTDRLPSSTMMRPDRDRSGLEVNIARMEEERREASLEAPQW